MQKQQRIILIVIVLLLVGFGLLRNNHRSFEFYVLRTSDGTNYIQDKQALFTDNEIASYNSKLRSITFKSVFINELNGVLAAAYPDRFVIFVDDKVILEGRFATPDVMSYEPPGCFVRPTETGVVFELGYEDGQMRPSLLTVQGLKEIGQYFTSY